MAYQRDTLWYTRCNSAPAASAFAIQTGRMQEAFAGTGLAIRPLRESPLPDRMEAHFDHGHADLFREGSNIPPLWACGRGSDVRIIGWHPGEHAQVLLAAPQSGIVRLDQLRGARLGLPRHRNESMDFWAATTLRLLLTGLELAGLTQDDVEIVELDAEVPWFTSDDAPASADPAARFRALDRMSFQRADVTALMSGRVDVIAATDFRAAELASLLGTPVLVDLGVDDDVVRRTSNLNPVVLTASGQLCRERPDIVTRYLRCTIETAQWAASNRESVLQLMGEGTASAPAAIGAGYGATFHEQLEPGFDPALVPALESQKRFLLEHGFIEADYDLADFIDEQPLRLAQGMQG